jgi:hypothetical protein
MNNPILDKIRKLLRLAKNDGASANEAATALRKAMELAEANGIDIQSVKLLDGETWNLTHHSEKSLAGTAHRLAAGIVQSHFGVEALFQTGSGWKGVHFIGQEINCQLASYAYIYLVRSMSRAWTKRENKRLRDRVSFLRGYAYSIGRLMPAAFPNPGLILSAKAYIETVLLGGTPGLKMVETKQPKKNLSQSALLAGLRAGKDAGIRNAIHGTNTPQIGA